MSKTWYREKKKKERISRHYILPPKFTRFFGVIIYKDVYAVRLSLLRERKLDLDLFYFLFSSQLEETDIRRG